LHEIANKTAAGKNLAAERIRMLCLMGCRFAGDGSIAASSGSGRNVQSYDTLGA
jgi:hypothetical protein